MAAVFLVIPVVQIWAYKRPQSAMSTLKSKKGFWDKLDKPILALAPMADVTDAAFRQLITRHGKPDIFFTEFVAVDGLCSAGRKNLVKDLRYQENERPIVAQFFGDKPENFKQSAELAVELGFDGIDINMGCPVKVVCKTGSGASLINEPELAKEIVQATIEGAGELPVSVKTRIGFSKITIEEWAGHLLEACPAAIIFHLRTKKEMSKVPAHWEVMPLPVEMAKGTGVLILGNGDVRSRAHAEQLVEETGVDGVLMGRAVYGNPWLFNRERRIECISLNEKFEAMIEHAHLFVETFGEERKFIGMRKHLMAYASGFPGAKEFRMSLENINSTEDVEQAIEAFRESHGDLLKIS